MDSTTPRPRDRSTRPPCPSAHHVASGTRTTCALWPPSPAWSAAARRGMPITSATPSPGPWAARWATRRNGGRNVRLTRSSTPNSCGGRGGTRPPSSPAAQQSKGADTSRPELNTGVYGNPGLEVLGDSGIFSFRHNNSPQRLTQGRWPDSHVTDARARETARRTPIVTSSVHAARGVTSRSIFLRRLRSATSRS